MAAVSGSANRTARQGSFFTRSPSQQLAQIAITRGDGLHRVPSDRVLLDVIMFHSRTLRRCEPLLPIDRPSTDLGEVFRGGAHLLGGRKSGFPVFDVREKNAAF